ncbi:hypothetical protein ACKJSM_28415 [Pseudomonas sp. PHC1]|uniref:hypothetical protein n=1 Tax=Pseudomonas sp. PHC1 TaxID=3384759 RepID=UPI00396F6D60
MALFFLEYDLRKQRNYQPLYDELARFKAVRMLESMWCFHRVNINAAGLRDHFQGFIDNDDGLIVSEVTAWASRHALGTPNNLP